MISLCQIDAAVRRVRYYNPDLELELLFLDDAEVKPEDVDTIAHIRNALVARVADIVKQASNQKQALDAAVSTVEILISSYNGYGDRPGRGHKHALQAIRLLASVPKRFDAAIDLFFDLVERSCAHNRGQTKFQGTGTSLPGGITTRMMQDYDQILVKLISRQWSKRGIVHWNVEAPIERIKMLRQIYDSSDKMSMISTRTFGRRRTQSSSAFFSESHQVLQKIEKASTELIWAVWMRNLKAQLRSWSKKQQPFDPTISTVSTASTFSDGDSRGFVSMESRRKFAPRDAEAYGVKHQMETLTAILDECPNPKYRDVKAVDVDTASSYPFSDETNSLRSHPPNRTNVYHAT